ncbi:MAG TPA: hypothetical protein VFI96_03380 [Longimicrobiaceae bacterium]|nr:hypothetical protein [Longimicrobiaceae bacterium]
MNLNPIGSNIGGVRLPETDPRVRQPQERAGRVMTPAAAPQVRPSQAPSVAQGSAPVVPAEPPAGTDPELWAVLTNDERAFFARAGAMGPLTYGYVLSQGQQTAVPSVRGGRLDVRG